MKTRLRARFRLLVVAQVLALVVSIALLTLTATNTEYIAVATIIGVIILLQVFGLLHFVEAHVDTLEDFFAAINYEDFTRQFVTDDIDAELKAAFNRVIDRFQQARAERELQAEYLETVVRHVPIPLMAVRSDGSLRLVNNPMRHLTGLPGLSRIEDLAVLDPALPLRMQSIEPGQQRLIQSRFREMPVELRVSVSEIRVEGNSERIYSIENLSGELTARESSAWRNLIRVITHEIMNTLTPVASLAQTCSSMLDATEATNDIREAIETIGRRSEGLIHFVERYRELLQVPIPEPEEISVLNAFNGVVALLRGELETVDLTINVHPDTLHVRADRALLDQVLINLVRNAAQALHAVERKKLTLSGKLDYGRVLIQVIDNGPGIPEALKDQIFIPFFTTKRDGSGIGLSLSRQIMTAHGGEIAAMSDGDSTVMSLLF